MRFHPYHGLNIRLLDEKRVAYRDGSFAHAISFSDQPLHPMEIFLIEIERNESGWSGHLRIGLTQLNPDSGFKLPQYALPDMANMGRSWIMAVTKSHNRVYEEGADGEQSTYKSILGEGDYVNTYKGPVSRNILKPLPHLKRKCSDEENHSSTSSTSVVNLRTRSKESSVLPTDVGSRIGIVYVVKDKVYANMHFIINGEDQGPCVKDIPYKEGPLFAVVDVYGTTKQVRIVPTTDWGKNIASYTCS